MKLRCRISQSTPRNVGWIRVRNNMIPLIVICSQKDEGESGGGDSALSVLEMSMNVVGLLTTKNFSNK